MAEGLITPEQLAEALAEKRTNERFSNALLRLGIASEAKLSRFLSQQYGIAVISLPQTPVPREIIKLIPPALARKHEVIPVERTPASLTLAIADPTNLSALDEVAFLTGLQVIPAIATPSVIRQSIERSYGPSTLAAAFEDGKAAFDDIEIVEDPQGASPDVMELKASADQIPVVRLVNMILIDGIERGVSDIHLEAEDTTFRVRFRIDGILQEVMAVPKRLEAAVVSRIKIMANLDIAERRLPHDGRIRLRHNGREMDFRVSVVPTIFGESVSIRTLDQDMVRLPLSALGFDPSSAEHFQRATRSPHGMIVITGPTGSGKTTTLYAGIQALNSPETNIVTIEDPIEYKMKGINQVQVNDAIGLSFASVLRAFLRHDPNVILVGEMRDTETAQVAVRASLTGHLVMSTLHTNDCVSTIARLLDLGVPAFLVASALRLVVAQRLVRRVCLGCREPYEAREERLVQYGHVPLGIGTHTAYRGKGCVACNSTGLKGRVALYEALPITPEIQSLILRNATAEILEAARREGMKTLREVGLLKVIEGHTTLQEVLRATSD